MSWSIIFTLIAAVLPFYKFGNYPNSERYKQWYIPIIMLVEALVLTYYYNKYSSAIVDVLRTFGYVKLMSYVDYVYVFACLSVMFTTKQLLKLFKLYERLAKWLPNLLENRSRYNDEFFYIPYLKKPMSTRPGVGFLSMFYIIMVILAIVIIAFSLLIGVDYDIYIKSGLFALSIPIFIELYNFYNTNLEYCEYVEEVDEKETVVEKPNKLSTLWNEYVELFASSFDVAFIAKNKINPNNIVTQNNYALNTVISEYKVGKDIIVEDLDVPDSFHKLSDIFFNSLTSGGNILILVDIAERLNLKVAGQDIPMMELFANYISDYLQTNVPSSTEILKLHYLATKAGEDQFKSRIILASVSTILESNIPTIKWFEDMDLLMVINSSDQGRINFFEYQKFNLLIEQKNKCFQKVILSPFRQGLQASLTKVWKLDRSCEKKLVPVVYSNNHYCIISNFDKWHENWLKMATPLGINLYSGIELSVPAINMGLEVSFLEIENAEVSEGREALGISLNHLRKYDLSQKNLDKQTHMNLLPFYMFKPYNQHFSIIYDVENNAPGMYNKWLHLGNNDNFSIVISKPYLLKSYFADNIHLFRRTPMYAIEPVPSASKVNLTILLYNILTEGRVSERQIKKILNDYSISLSQKSVPVFLRELFIRYFNFDIEENSRLKVEETVVFDKNDFNKEYLYSLAPFKISHFPQFSPLRAIKIMDNRGILRFTILKDMLFQNYMLGQKHAFNGRTFEITSYDDGEGVMTIHNLPQFNNHLFYMSCFKITYEGKRLESSVEDRISFKSLNSEFTITLFEASLAVETNAYYEFRKQYQAITQSNIQEVLRVDLSSAEKSVVKRNYRNCRVLKVEWQIENEFIGDIPKIQAGVHLLLFEVFRSFFPYSYQYLIICSSRLGLTTTEQKHLAEFPWIFPEFESATKENCIELFIFEDSTSDIGVLNAVRENYIYILQYVYDYLCWLQEADFDGKSKEFERYMNSIGDKFEFLKYGFDEIPSFLDINVLKDFSDKHFPLDKITKIELQEARRADLN